MKNPIGKNPIQKPHEKIHDLMREKSHGEFLPAARPMMSGEKSPWFPRTNRLGRHGVLVKGLLRGLMACGLPAEA